LIKLKFYVPINRKTDHFRNILLSQLLNIVLKKLNAIQQQQTSINTPKHIITQNKFKTCCNSNGSDSLHWNTCHCL